MPSSLLFSVNNEGRVYTLSTGHSMWRELQYVGQEFKRLSAVPHFLWAVGGDHQIYLYVHGLDIPIRVKEESYENERWLPLEGFSSRLLPTDRYHFSNIDGTVDRAIDKIRVPSMAWQWEGDWHLDLTLDGQALDHTGWSYAVDFPAHYHVQKQWKSCVRRRKWIRYRRYSAMNSWCAIAPLHKDPTHEPFIDVSIGGQNVPGAGNTAGVVPMSVWAVTAHGRVFYRTGVSTTSPEGQRWTFIPLPPQCEVHQISVGPTGLVWAILLNGRALVRHGINKDNLTGTTWLEVRPPGDNLRLIHISVGTNSVWAVTNDKKVWFRKGIRGDAADISEDMAMGSGWVEMVGNMSCVSVAPNDQVWGVGAEDRCIYFRSGVTSNELTGKKWRMVQAAVQLSRASSNASLNSMLHRQSLSGSIRDKHRSLSALNRPHSTYVEPSSLPWRDSDEQSHSAPTTTLRNQQRPSSLSGDANLDIIHDSSMSSISEHNKDPEGDKIPEEITGKHFETTLKNPKAWSPVRSVGSVVGTEAHPETDCSIFDADLTRDSGVYGDDDDTATFYWAESDSMWSWVEAGACTVDPNQLPNWFLDVGSSQQTDLTQSWRIKILEKLRSRITTLSEVDYKDYENAIETTSWVRKGEGRCLLPTESVSNVVFEDCIFELEWIDNSATFTILNPDGATTKSQFSLTEVTAVTCVSEPGNPRLAIHVPQLFKSPIKLQFTGDTDMEDWMANLTTVCCKMNDVHGRPSNQSIWTITALGDVFVFDPTTMEASQQQENEKFLKNFDVSGKDLPVEEILYNGCGTGTVIEVTGCVHDDAERVAINLVSHPVLKIKHKAVNEVRFIPLHFNPRFNDDVVVRNSMIEGEWGNEERSGGLPLQKGQEFSIVIICEEKGFKILVNNEEFCWYEHRLPPKTIHKIEINGKVKLFKLSYQCNNVIVSPLAMFWRQMGGHLRRVETCSHGVTWGLGYDHTAWVYTGGWGGAFLKGLESSTEGINPMCDIQDYYVYENQRWNPLTGYTSTGLPTDRYMWSDVTGRHKRNKEHIKLLSMHCHWVSDWMIDFHTPGGVDRDGWQYAVDFPATYHANKQFTDYVRRRRWYRRCAITTTGPWLELTGSTKILDISLHVSDKGVVDSPIFVWAVAAKGDAIFRRGVSSSNPSGSVWEHVPSDQPLAAISCGPGNDGTNEENHFYQVWAVGRNGSAFWRSGITDQKPQGENWITVEPPSGGQLKQISVGRNMIWALDNNGRICVRKEITNVFPEGSHWQILQNDPPHTDVNPNTSSGFRHVSVGNNEVWAVTNNGYICCRCGITNDNPAGTGWNYGIQGNFQYVTVRGFQS